jgi:protoheme IX farnesyltransferase
LKKQISAIPVSSVIDLSHMFKSFFELMKPRVMSLVIFTALVGMVIAPTQPDFLDASLSLFFVALGAGAAGALNMWYDAEIDGIMTRTCLRPIPLGKIKNNHALVFGTVLSFISVAGLYFFSNFLSALILAITILFYIFIYTIWLKRRTPQNIVIGGAAGAFPPVIGWTISTNTIGIEPIILFLIIFLWTPSHFWALSLYKNEDYKKAKIPMLSVVSGEEVTKKNILFYSIILWPFTLAPYFLNFASYSNFAFVVIFGFFYIFLSFKLLITKTKSASNKIARNIFIYSIFYLFFIFSTILIDNYFFI